MTTAWNNMITFFVTTWNNIVNTAKAVWNALPGFFAGLWNTIRAAIVNAWSGFLTTITTTCNNIKTGVINIWNAVIDWFKALPGTLLTIGANMFTSMQTGVNNTINNVVSAVKTGIGTAIDWIKGLPGEALQWGKDIINGIVNGIKSAASAVGDAVKGVAQDIRKFLHFSEPDEGPLVGFGTWMPDMMETLRGGILSNIGRVSSAASQVASTIAGAIPTDLSSTVQVRTALAAAGGYSSASSVPGASAPDEAQAVLNSQAPPQIHLSLVTPDGRTLGKFVAPYVGQQLEFDSKSMFPSKG